MSLFVYFVQAGDARGPIKIGYSRNVEKRIESLQTGNHLPIRLLAKIDHPNAPDIERGLHAEFADIRLEGEWFRADERITSVIAALSGASNLSAALKACPAKMVSADPTWFVVEWSHRTGHIHIDHLVDSLDMARQILLFGRGHPQDYTIIAIAPSREDAHEIAIALEPTLRAVRLVRRLTGENR